MKKTMIILERLLNDKHPPKEIKTGVATRLMPYGTWYRKHHPEEFMALFNKWKVKEE